MEPPKYMVKLLQTTNKMMKKVYKMNLGFS
jgi:hypothetical protein